MVVVHAGRDSDVDESFGNPAAMYLYRRDHILVKLEAVHTLELVTRLLLAKAEVACSCYDSASLHSDSLKAALFDCWKGHPLVIVSLDNYG